MSITNNDTSRSHERSEKSGSTTTKWSDIDKTRLYGIGTVMYSGLTMALHPLTVIKIRRQTQTADLSRINNIQVYYRGLGVVLSLAIPARAIYVSVLESSREFVDQTARQIILCPPSFLQAHHEKFIVLLPFVAPFSGGVAGGLAAFSSQLVVVPMDVISQKQMVMQDSLYMKCGSAISVTKSLISSEGLRGIFRGFGLSLFTSLPTGSIWWATYAGSKDQLSMFGVPTKNEVDAIGSYLAVARSGVIQVISAFNAAFISAIFTQPLDTIKTRLQVLGSDKGTPSPKTSVFSIAKELSATSGLYQGLLPRIVHMGVWGSVLSSAYEYLKEVSRKDYHLVENISY